MNLSARERLIVALDVNNLAEAKFFLNELKEVEIFKVGLQLFVSSGSEIIKLLHKNKKKIFLDLKFHDISNTVIRAAEIATSFKVHMFNLHIVVGEETLKETVLAVKEKAKKLNIVPPKILGVTVLTNINQKILKEQLKINKEIEEYVLHLAKLAKNCGLDGVVASPKEIKKLRKFCGQDFIIVTPGVRPAWSVSDEHKRFLTPAEAIKLGADYIVVGRPIIKADNPNEAVKKILKEISGKNF